MAKTRAIVKRRKAVQNIRKITRTMELIATARFKKAMDRAIEADAYTKRIAELVSDLGKSGAAAKHPLLEERPQVKRSILLVLTANRGLCGGYNANVLRAANNAIANQGAIPFDLEVSGKRGITAFRHRKIPIAQTYTHFEEKPSFLEVDVLATRYLNLFLEGKIDRLDVAYTKFISIGKQQAVVATLLPMTAVSSEESKKTEEKQAPKVDYEFMPSAADILNEIVPVSFKVRLFKAFLDAAVSEQISRMVAMKGATENAGDMISTLSRVYNRARQSQITSEY